MIDSKTKLIALIGNPIEHSLSPAMHNAAFQELNLNCIYLAFKVEKDSLQKAIDAIRALGIAGLSVTLPHKTTCMQFLDSVDSMAEKIQAVNTIVNKNGNLKGYNTDCIGTINALKEKTALANKKTVLLGAGGAAKAIAFGLHNEKAELVILNRTVEHAKQLASAIDCEYGGLGDLEKELSDAKILINATSVGMYPNVNESIVPKKLLKDLVVFDAVYNPIKTRLLKDAEEKKCKIVLGLRMFVEQGAEQFRLWTGRQAPKETMEKTVRKELLKKELIKG